MFVVAAFVAARFVAREALRNLFYLRLDNRDALSTLVAASEVEPGLSTASRIDQFIQSVPVRSAMHTDNNNSKRLSAACSRAARRQGPAQAGCPRWLNGTVMGIGLASLCSDCWHEIATTVMPAFLATMGVAAAWVGIIEGVSDGLSSFAKMASGYYTDKLRRREPIGVAGYLVTA